MRGEEAVPPNSTSTTAELPPHARRRARSIAQAPAAVGITSACAEKRLVGYRGIVGIGNYLRMRGEEPLSCVSSTATRELPPHARRRVPRRCRCFADHGITSACAEKSAATPRRLQARRNYLRMRGEEFISSTPTISMRELPPHARRRGDT